MEGVRNHGEVSLVRAVSIDGVYGFMKNQALTEDVVEQLISIGEVEDRYVARHLCIEVLVDYLRRTGGGEVADALLVGVNGRRIARRLLN